MKSFLQKLVRTRSFEEDFVHEDILEHCWKVEIDNLVAVDGCFEQYFENAEYSDVTIYVAGKEDGPNALSLKAAESILLNLSHYLDIYDSAIGFHWNDGWWKLESLVFPYQVKGIWYMYLSSEYGADYCYCWVKEDDVLEEYKGIVVDCPGDGSIAQVLPTVCAVINNLRECAQVTAKLSEIDLAIESRKTIGLDLINPLMQITEQHKSDIPEYMYSHLTKLLGGIRKNAENS
ncbi:hypothetical protein Mag101_00880 [Microbulbifer agarilyticus]|uniref:Uncharacterized protein n=1 Tax=Microbulbifer agarilyticus TaxID=260552 RepID=A0A1Q2M0Y0_9GAMM|nr:hypothetical protein [Microbulbifer agarilyticus]AQQ66361.1 hypothetical protein Mag101_00880 [Microbulbifer agarilyticus]